MNDDDQQLRLSIDSNRAHSSVFLALPSEMRAKKDRWNMAWDGLLRVALSSILIPLLWPHSFGPSSWRSSQFVEWEVLKARHPLLLDGITRNLVSSPEPEGLWKPPAKAFRSCPSPAFPSPSSHGTATEGYLQVFLEGGLNQQRMGVCDAVAVAKILNVTLILPHFDVNPVWQDTSTFADIFDVDHFLKALEDDVRIVTELPLGFEWSTREYYGTGIRETRIKDAPSHAKPSWFLGRVLPVIRTHGIAAIAPFSHRLGFEGIPTEIQQLRCRVNFDALRFKPALRHLGDLIVQRLHRTASWTMSGKIPGSNPDDKFDDSRKGIMRIENAGVSKRYVALHLRFDKDMAAHSACGFGGGRAEELALEKYRRDVWQGRVSNQMEDIERVRELGKCPLTPEEVGIVLVGLGFRKDTVLYLASHKVYGGEERMAHLRALFPFVVDKYSLTTEGEIEPFKGKSSQLAALDYHVSLHSDAFMSASRGNMHNALVGHRAYEVEGLTVRLDMVLVAQLFREGNMSWFGFQERLRAGHKNRMGQLNIRKPAQSIYTYPAPDCMCAVG